MYANITIQLVTFVSVGLKVVKNGGNIWGEEYILVFFSKRVSTPYAPEAPESPEAIDLYRSLLNYLIINNLSIFNIF